MPGEMFGAPAGIQAAEQSQATLARTQGQLIENQQNALALKQSQMMFDLAQNYRAQQGAPGQAEPSPLDGVTAMEKMGNLYIHSGLVKQGGDMLEKAALVRSHMGTATKAELDSKIKELTMAADLLDGVTDQASMDRASMFYMETTGKQSPLAGRIYSPDLVAQARNLVTTQKDRAAIEASKASAALRRSEQELIPAKKAHLKAVTDLAETRTSALKKAGATGAVAKPSDIKKASEMILVDYPGMRPEESRTIGQRMAERAGELLASNKALTQSQALAKAYHEEKLAGTFSSARRTPARAVPPPVAGATAKGKGWILPPAVSKSFGVPPGTLAMPGQFTDKESGMIWIGGPMGDPSSWEYPEAGEEAE